MLVLPFKFSFYGEEENKIWDNFDTAVDIAFLIDILLTFITPYYHNDKLVISLRRIAINYLKFWFWIDAISTFPLELIIDSGGQMVSLVRLARINKIYSILKISRLLRSMKALREQNNVWNDMHRALKFNPSTQLLN